jgi:hypothetical protein
MPMIAIRGFDYADCPVVWFVLNGPILDCGELKDLHSDHLWHIPEDRSAPNALAKEIGGYLIYIELDQRNHHEPQIW